jgi:hypothetical protein
MPTQRIEEFARRLVEDVRDKAIRTCEMNLRAGVHNPIAERWRALVHDPAALGAAMAADCVDAAICALLRALDEGSLPLTYRADDGTCTDLTEDGEGKGELVGWYMGVDGWRERYSKQRVSDDFSGLG